MSLFVNCGTREFVNEVLGWKQGKGEGGMTQFEWRQLRLHTMKSGTGAPLPDEKHNRNNLGLEILVDVMDFMNQFTQKYAYGHKSGSFESSSMMVSLDEVKTAISYDLMYKIHFGEKYIDTCTISDDQHCKQICKCCENLRCSVAWMDGAHGFKVYCNI